MKSSEFIFEGRSMKVICVDVQPDYANFSPQIREICDHIIHFVNKQTGPVLMFVNAEETGQTPDSIYDIKYYWESVMIGDNDPADYYDAGGGEPVDWSRFTIVDKGYGYLRSWMDHQVSPKSIIKTIRLMYQNKVSDSRELFGGEDSDDYEINMKAFYGYDFIPLMLHDAISINWTSVAQLKRFNGAYIVGGGKEQCLREVEILMNAFNIKYKRIDSLVYRS